MKKLLIFLLLFCSTSLFGQSYDVLNYYYDATPTHGVKIRTKLPFSNGSQMPTVRIEGFAYGRGRAIGINLVWYIYNGNFTNYSASSFGSHTPDIYLSNENGYVTIFLNERTYYERFKVSVFAYGMSEQASWFQDWTTDDEALGGTNQVLVGYHNQFKGEININNGIWNTDDKIGIGTVNPLTKIHITDISANSPQILIENSSTYGLRMGLNAQNRGFLGSVNATPIQIITGGEERMNFDLSGRVGIGNTQPAYKLDVSGKVSAFAEADNNGWSMFRANYGNGVNGSIQALRMDAFGVTTAAVGFGTTSETGDGGLRFWTRNLNSLEERMRIINNGNVGIGVVNPSEKLSVDGNIKARKLIITQQGWSDYVFDPAYKLKPLLELEKFIKINQHLPEVPSTKEVEGKEINVGDTQALLLRKIEELTLYIIEQQKQINELKTGLKSQKRKK